MMAKQGCKILFAAGGTGGHVFPALAIADEIKKLNANTEFLFVGTQAKIEARVVPQRGYSFAAIWISGFHRSLRISNLLFPVKVIVSLVQSFFLIKRFQPHVVVGTGGYVCGPVLYTASMMGIPIVVHESNSFPGITTRMLSVRASRIFTAFEATTHWLKRKDNVEVVGTPTREELGSISRIKGIEFFQLDPNKKTVLVFGGSLGAASINHTMKQIAPELAAMGVQVVWQTGKTDSALVHEMQSKNIGWIDAFIDTMEMAYAAADLIVCRAGATTLAELTRLGKAAILIPYPHAAADHQTFNAKTLVDAGAAVMIADTDVSTHLLGTMRSLLKDDVQLKNISTACVKLGHPDAGKIIAQRVLAIAA
jgi:UDP-N-acetylglucosamine--N-acetylmuramyl-(pentapeptide) pyrophosphoryl-undecaprenol N-acetylglucosamine transferase